MSSDNGAIEGQAAGGWGGFGGFAKRLQASTEEITSKVNAATASMQKDFLMDAPEKKINGESSSQPISDNDGDLSVNGDVSSTLQPPPNNAEDDATNTSSEATNNKLSSRNPADVDKAELIEILSKMNKRVKNLNAIRVSLTERLLQSDSVKEKLTNLLKDEILTPEDMEDATRNLSSPPEGEEVDQVQLMTLAWRNVDEKKSLMLQQLQNEYKVIMMKGQAEIEKVKKQSEENIKTEVEKVKMQLNAGAVNSVGDVTREEKHKQMTRDEEVKYNQKIKEMEQKQEEMKNLHEEEVKKLLKEVASITTTTSLQIEKNRVEVYSEYAIDTKKLEESHIEERMKLQNELASTDQSYRSKLKESEDHHNSDLERVKSQMASVHYVELERMKKETVDTLAAAYEKKISKIREELSQEMMTRLNEGAETLQENQNECHKLSMQMKQLKEESSLQLSQLSKAKEASSHEELEKIAGKHASELSLIKKEAGANLENVKETMKQKFNEEISQIKQESELNLIQMKEAAELSSAENLDKGKTASNLINEELKGTVSTVRKELESSKQTCASFQKEIENQKALSAAALEDSLVVTSEKYAAELLLLKNEADANLENVKENTRKTFDKEISQIKLESELNLTQVKEAAESTITEKLDKVKMISKSIIDKLKEDVLTVSKKLESSKQTCASFQKSLENQKAASAATLENSAAAANEKHEAELFLLKKEADANLENVKESTKKKFEEEISQVKKDNKLNLIQAKKALNSTSTKKLDEAKTASKAMIEKWKGEVSTMRQELESSKKTCASFQKSLENQKAASAAALEDSAAISVAAASGKEMSNQKLEEALSKQRENFEMFSQSRDEKHTAEMEQHQVEQEKMRSQLEEYNTEKEELRTEIEDSNSKFDQLQMLLSNEQLMSKTKEVERKIEFDEAVERLRKESQSNADEVVSLTQSAKDVELSNSKLSEEFNELKSENEKLGSAVSQLRDNLQSEKLLNKETFSAKEEHDKSISQLREEVQSKDAKLEKISISHTKLGSKHSSLKSTVETVQESNAELKLLIDQMTSAKGTEINGIIDQYESDKKKAYEMVSKKVRWEFSQRETELEEKHKKTLKETLEKSKTIFEQEVDQLKEKNKEKLTLIIQERDSSTAKMKHEIKSLKIVHSEEERDLQNSLATAISEKEKDQETQAGVLQTEKAQSQMKMEQFVQEHQQELSLKLGAKIEEIGTLEDEIDSLKKSSAAAIIEGEKVKETQMVLLQTEKVQSQTKTEQLIKRHQSELWSKVGAKIEEIGILKDEIVSVKKLNANSMAELEKRAKETEKELQKARNDSNAAETTNKELLTLQQELSITARTSAEEEATMKTEYEEKLQKSDVELSNATARVEKLKAEFSEKFSTLKTTFMAKVKILEEEKNDHVSRIENDKDDEIANMKKDYEDRLQLTTKEKKDLSEKLAAEFDSTMKIVQNEYSDQFSRLDQEKSSLLEEVKKDHASELQKAKNEYTVSLVKVKKNRDTLASDIKGGFEAKLKSEIEKMTTKQSFLVEKMNTEFEKKLNTANAEHSSAIAEIMKKNDKATKTLEAVFEKKSKFSDNDTLSSLRKLEKENTQQMAKSTSSYEGKLKSMKYEHDKLVSSITNTKDKQLSLLAGELKSVNTLSTSLNDDNDNLQSKLRSQLSKEKPLHELIASLKKELDMSAASSSATTTTLLASKEKLETERDGLKEEISTLQDDLISSKNKVEELDGKFHAISGNIEFMLEDKKYKEKKIKEQEKKLQDASRRTDKTEIAEAEVTSLREEVNALKLDQARNNSLISRVQAEKDASERKNGQRTALIGMLEAQLAELNDANNDSKAKLEASLYDLSQKDDTVQSMTEQLEKIEKALAEAKQVRKGADSSRSFSIQQASDNDGKKSRKLESLQREVQVLQQSMARKSSAAQRLLQEREAECVELRKEMKKIQFELDTGSSSDRTIFELAAKQSNRDTGAATDIEIRDHLLHRMTDELVSRDADLADAEYVSKHVEIQVEELSRIARREDVDLDYLKSVVVQYLSKPPGSSERAALLPVLATLLQFDKQDYSIIEQGKQKVSWLWGSVVAKEIVSPVPAPLSETADTSNSHQAAEITVTQPTPSSKRTALQF